MRQFTEEQLERYSRHILLAEVGVEGQERLMEGRVLVVGAGGLGSPVALYLAAAGVGVVGIVDNDTVDRSNLQRQIAHTTADIGQPKVESAARAMRAINPEVQVVTHHCFLDASNVRQLVRQYDFVIDGADNFPTKFLVNDACLLEGVPFSHGGILRFTGQTMTVLPGKSACYRCVFREPPPPDAVPSCSQAGVLGAVAGMLGTIQAAEALKFLTGAGELLTNRLLSFDALAMRFRSTPLQRQDNCPVCGKEPSITEVTDCGPILCAA